MLDETKHKAKSKKYKAIQQKLIDLTADAKAFQTIANKQIRDRRLKISADAYRDIYDAVATLAKERGIKLVLTKDQPGLDVGNTRELLNRLYHRRQVMYADEVLDITDDVIEVLNAK